MAVRTGFILASHDNTHRGAMRQHELRSVICPPAAATGAGVTACTVDAMREHDAVHSIPYVHRSTAKISIARDHAVVVASAVGQGAGRPLTGMLLHNAVMLQPSNKADSAPQVIKSRRITRITATFQQENADFLTIGSTGKR